MHTKLATALLICPLGLGCAKTAPSPTKTQAPLSAGGIARDAAPGSLRQKISRAGVLNELHELGIFYIMYNTENNRSPGSLEEFRPYIQRDAPKLYKAIKDGFYEVKWKVTEMNAENLLAYEKTGDEIGGHQALMGDGHVTKLNEAQILKILKNK
jgi:hypothetical protein